MQFIKHIKREAMTCDIPVVMLTARGEEEDCVRGLKPARTITSPNRSPERAGGASKP
ncbi:hypothetical protein ACVXG7_00125 [Enterobacter hormaechei]